VTWAVFDCVILLQATGRPSGPAGACLQAVRYGRLELFLTPDILAEVLDLLTRPKKRRKFAALTPDAGNVFLADLAGHATMLAAVSKVFPLPRDPKDEPFIDLAVAAQALYLVSRHNDLLDLMGDAAFQQQFPDLTVIDPLALLREPAPTPKPEPEPEQGPAKGKGQGEAVRVGEAAAFPCQTLTVEVPGLC
jgi:putative PIN family toxin of toxin-antitoxin system